MALIANLKTFLISILSLSATNHGKYSKWVKAEECKAVTTAPGETLCFVEGLDVPRDFM